MTRNRCSLLSKALCSAVLNGRIQHICMESTVQKWKKKLIRTGKKDRMAFVQKEDSKIIQYLPNYTEVRYRYTMKQYLVHTRMHTSVKKSNRAGFFPRSEAINMPSVYCATDCHCYIMTLRHQEQNNNCSSRKTTGSNDLHGIQAGYQLPVCTTMTEM